MNLYAKAIDILTTEQDWKAICIEIAKSNPSALIKATGEIGTDNTVRDALREGATKIDAIKLYRVLTGAGLKEAKEAVEALQTTEGGEG